MGGLKGYAFKGLQAPKVVTGAGVTGSWIDTQGLIGDVENVKAVIYAGAGTTAGTAGGSIQSATDTSGTGLSTRATFSTLTSAGGSEEKHFSIEAHRYVRFIGSVASGKDMLLSAFLVAKDRVV